jgi:hypothetical protein
MRKYKIESRRDVGCIKNLDITAPGDSFRAVGVVNMLRTAMVLEVSAHGVSPSDSDLYLTHRWWLTH